MRISRSCRGLSLLVADTSCSCSIGATLKASAPGGFRILSKGWLCKTWRGIAMVSMPGSMSRIFFTVWGRCNRRTDQQVMGKRVSLHYEEKVGIRRVLGETGTT